MRMMGRRGMVASPHYLATGAGVNVLRRGGNAIDAAIATNAVLGVVSPYVCGLGGDLFALIYTRQDGQLAGLNGSGRASAAATADEVRRLAGDRMPERGPLTVTVPGCVEAWGQLHRRFGRLDLGDSLSEAVYYAREGFPVTAEFAAAIQRSARIFHPDTPAAETFLPHGSPPTEGQVLVQPRLARTLETIGRDGPEEFYRGALAKELVRALQSVGGLMTLQDLAEHHSDWVEPLSTRYRDVTVYELPPNSQGIVALLMLSILQHLPEEALRVGEAEYVHLVAEVARLAYADREAYLTDIDHMAIPPAALLDPEYARRRAAEVGERAAPRVQPGSPGDTIYLCTADGEGNLVSLIESNFMGIGSGVMGGETGVMLQNRGAWFSLQPDHANVIAPRKRTMHTLMPGMAFRGGQPWLVFGTMGGSAQAEINVQLLARIVDQGMAVDEALAAPRFDAVVGADAEGRPVLLLESGFSEQTVEELRKRDHGVTVLETRAGLGHAHAIQLLGDGVYVGAADPRTHSLALGY